MSCGRVFPSYYEKNADGITFQVAPWVGKYLSPEHLHGPEWQPVFTCHDITDWKAWCGGGDSLWNTVSAACLERWESWRAKVGLDPRRGDPWIHGSGFWVRPGKGRVAECEGARVRGCESAREWEGRG
jgi:hypothetical protein